VAKTRCPVLQGQVIARPGAALAQTLTHWLQGEQALRYGDGTAVNMTNAAEVEVFTSYQVQKGSVPPTREEARAFYKSAVVA
ncbi:MAG: hypothetical protein KDE56_23520, partial [Anaerolineales bacterium]|nr:hypothetical protein [Anaerolineales bacterium]